MSQKNKLTWLQKIIVNKLASTRVGRRLLFDKIQEGAAREFYEDNLFSIFYELSKDLVETSGLNISKDRTTALISLFKDAANESMLITAHDMYGKSIKPGDFVFAPSDKSIIRSYVSNIANESVHLVIPKASGNGHLRTEMKSSKCILAAEIETNAEIED